MSGDVSVGVNVSEYVCVRVHVPTIKRQEEENLILN